MIKQIITTIWAILFFISVLSLYVFVHEATHALRFDEPEMMCLGFGESFGHVYHETSMTESEIFQEEVIANIVASVASLIYIITSFYMIVYFKEA